MSHQSPVALCLALLASSALAAPGALNESAPAVADSIPWPNPTLAGCEESRPFTLLDDFSDGGEENELGGYWFPIWDTSAFPPDWRDWKEGRKHMDVIPGEPLNESRNLPGFIRSTTILKQCQESDPDARIATSSVGVRFPPDGAMLSGGDSLTGISFRLSLPKVGTLVRSVRFFAIQEERDSGWSERGVDIPFSGIDSGATRTVCIRPSDLKTFRHSENVGMEPVDPKGFFHLEWMVRATSSPNPFGAYDTTVFTLADVRFHGSENFQSSAWLEPDTTKIPGEDTIFRWPGKQYPRRTIVQGITNSMKPYQNSLHTNTTCTNPNVGTRTRSRPAPTLAVRTESNSLLLTGTDGFRQFEILSADGRSLKRFAPTSRLQIDLPRGAYLLVGEGPNKREVRPFAVAK